MDKIKASKWLAFIAAVISGVGVALGGDVVQGVGIIAASLSSVSLLRRDA